MYEIVCKHSFVFFFVLFLFFFFNVVGFDNEMFTVMRHFILHTFMFRSS